MGDSSTIAYLEFVDDSGDPFRKISKQSVTAGRGVFFFSNVEIKVTPGSSEYI